MHSFGLGRSNQKYTKLPTIEAKNLQSRQISKNCLYSYLRLAKKFKIVGKAAADVLSGAEWRLIRAEICLSLSRGACEND